MVTGTQVLIASFYILRLASIPKLFDLQFLPVVQFMYLFYVYIFKINNKHFIRVTFIFVLKLCGFFYSFVSWS